MKKRMEDMTREEVLKEFEGSEVLFRVGKRPGRQGILAIRVPSDIKWRLGEEAKKRDVSGYTTMARILIEEGLKRSSDEQVRKSGKKTAVEALRKLRSAESEVSRVLLALAK